MKYHCSVLGCSNTSDDGIRLHEFPFDNELMLPIWTMATHRSNWLPLVESRICDEHFNIDDYEKGNKNKNLKPNACPMMNTSNNISNESIVFGNKSPLSPSVDNFDADINIDNPALEFDVVSLSSSTSVENDDQLIKQKCAVVLCNENIRKQFDNLFFINFPTHNITLCHYWWKICGHNDTFDPLSKLCSIHFNTDDFTTDTVRRDGQLYRQTILNSNCVPSRYLLQHEFTKITRKRKLNTKNRKIVKKKLFNVKKCAVPSCQKIFLKDGPNSSFFQFPLKKKNMLKKWINNLGLSSNWKPLETDVICFDHFENHCIVKNKDNYVLNKNAIPSIKIDNWFVTHPESNNSKHCIKEPNYSYDFSNLDFHKINENSLMVKEKMSHKNENDPKIKTNHVQIPVTATTQSDLTKKICNTRKPLLTSPKTCSESHLEYIPMDNLDDDGIIEELSTIYNGSDSSTKQYLESFESDIGEGIVLNENSNNDNFDLEYVYMDENNENMLESMCNITELIMNENENNSKNSSSINVSNVICNDEISTEKCALNVTEMEMIMNNIVEETNIPKSQNNGSENDYVYLDMLNDDAGKFLSLQKKCTVNNSKKNIPESSTFTYPTTVPKSIIYDQSLTENYGEMLPPNCSPDCQLQCYTIPGPMRRKIFNVFYSLKDVTAQNCEITQLVKLRMVKKGSSTFESCPSYNLLLNNELVKVCRLFFMNTLGIPENRIDSVLKPKNYIWYSDKDTALQANQPKYPKLIKEAGVMTDFLKESLMLLDTDYNLFEPESDTEISLDNVSVEEYEKVLLLLKSIPRVLSSYNSEQGNKIFFETSICLDHMYTSYSEYYLKNHIPPPYTKRQFKKIYNKYMKKFL